MGFGCMATLSVVVGRRVVVVLPFGEMKVLLHTVASLVHDAQVEDGVGVAKIRRHLMHDTCMFT